MALDGTLMTRVTVITPIRHTGFVTRYTVNNQIALSKNTRTRADDLITTLRTKILIVLLIIFALIGGMTYVIHNQVLTPSFLELERQHVNDNILRVRSYNFV